MSNLVSVSSLTIFLAFLLSVSSVQAIGVDEGEPIAKLEDSMKVFAYAMIRDSSYESRKTAHLKFEALLDEALNLPNSFEHPFDSIETVSIQYDSKKEFRILTWQICESSNRFHYYGYIQTSGKEPQLFKLKDRSEEVRMPQREILTADKWFGALYYNMHEVKIKRKKYYLLFGFDANDLQNRRKLVEVLQFKKGKPSFGAPIFVTREIEGKVMETANRFVLTYSPSSAIRLNYDKDLKMVVYDNLIPFPSPYQQEGFGMVPDGSYRGLEFRNKLWYPVERLFTQTQEVAPRPNPILDDRKGNSGLFGPAE